MSKQSFVCPNMSLLLSSTVARAPNSSTLVLQAKGALLFSLVQLGKQAVLYGSAALNLYLPPRHRLPCSDLDFYIVVATPECFGDIVQRTCTVVNKQLRLFFSDASISVSWYLLSHGPDEITMSVSVNGIKFADLTRQFVHKIAPLECVFPRLRTKAVLPGVVDELDIWTISFQEAAHRIACTVACLPCLDGSPVIPLHANAGRVAKDTGRLAKLNDLSCLGLLSMEPSSFVLDAKEAKTGPVAAGVFVDPTTGVAMPSFFPSKALAAASLALCSAVSECHVVPRSCTTMSTLDVSNAVADFCVKPDNVFRRKRVQSVLACRQKSLAIRNDLASLKRFVQEQAQTLAKHAQFALADTHRVVKRRERNLRLKTDKAAQSERFLSAQFSALTKTAEEQKATIRRCRDTIKDGLDSLVATTSAAVILKDLFASLRAECRLVVTKLTLVLKVITDRSPDNFDVQSLADSYDKLLSLYVEKRVPGFVDRTASPSRAVSSLVCGDVHCTDTFITMHSQMVRSMLKANDILIGKLDDSSTFTYASKSQDGVQFTEDAELLEPRESVERRAELLNKHAESALVLMIMPAFERLAYINRLARATVNDCAENSSLLVLLKMTRPGASDWACLDAAEKVATRMKRVHKTLSEHM